MRLFLDCEFNEFQGALISMALVAEDGREFYEAVPCDNPGSWVAQHVIPILQIEPVPLHVFRIRLCRWLSQFESIHVVADWPEDIAHFCSALITAPGCRMSTPPLTMEVFRIDAESNLPHNALADAHGIRVAIAALAATGAAVDQDAVHRGCDAELQEDMGCGRLRLTAQDDGDMCLLVIEDIDQGTGQSAGVEFCASGGKSPKTLQALRDLSRAMREDAALTTALKAKS